MYRLSAFVFAAILAFTPSFASAETRIWDSFGPSDQFGDGDNWLFDGVVPGAADTAQFQGVTDESVRFSDDFTNDSLEIVNSTVSFDLNGQTYTLTNPNNENFNNSTSILVGTSFSTVGFTSSLSVTDGTLAGVEARVGNTQAGAMTVGADAIVSLSDEMIVGFQNTGTLTVENGGQVQSVTGSIGNQSSGDGVVNIMGMNSNWTLDDYLYVGTSGAGELNITGGGMVSTTDANAGHITSTIVGLSGSQSSSLTVSGSGSTLNAESLTVGGSGIGSMTVESGGQVVNTWFANIGNQAAGDGSALVTGANSKWTTAGLTVGWRGPGELSIENSGAVESSNVVQIGRETTATGQLTITGAGSVLSTTSAFANDGIYVGGDTTGAQGDGTLTVASGGSVDLGTQSLTVWQTGELNGDGGSITGDVTNHGLVSPGASPGVMTINGDYTQAADGTLLLEIAGTTPGTDYDQFIINGNATLDGTLILRFIDSFVPDDGDLFNFLTVSGALNDDLLDIQIENLPDSFDTDVAFSNGAFNLTVTGDAIPTPAAAPMALCLLAALSLKRRR